MAPPKQQTHHLLVIESSLQASAAFLSVSALVGISCLGKGEKKPLLLQFQGERGGVFLISILVLVEG